MSDPVSIAALVEVGIDVARWLWHRTHGKDTKPDETALREMAIAAAKAQVARLAAELQRITEVQTATEELSLGMSELMEELRTVSAKPGLIASVLPEMVEVGPDEKL